MNIYAYLRASTEDQNASRALDSLQSFAESHGKEITETFIENASGTKADRPELLRMLSVASEGDVILVEQIDRLTRLSPTEWEDLKNIINNKKLVIVTLDVPSSHMALKSEGLDEITAAIIKAVNTMLLDVLAVVAYKDNVTRKQRQAQGIEQYKAKGGTFGPATDTELHTRVQELLLTGNYNQRDIASMAGCSQSLVAKINRKMKVVNA